MSTSSSAPLAPFSFPSYPSLSSSIEKPIFVSFHEVSEVPAPDHVLSVLHGSISDPSSNSHVICTTCMEKVPHKKWRDHTYKHVKFKPFLCTCGLQFSAASPAKRHVRSTFRPFSCFHCDRFFTRKHVRDAHQLACALTYLREPATRGETLVSEYSYPPVIHLHSIEESTVGADVGKNLTEAASSSYRVDRNIARMSTSPQIALLKMKDVDGNYIDILLYERPSWQELCSFLVAKQVLAKQHLSAGDCVVYTLDGRVLFDQEWDNWIADAIDGNTSPQLQVELRVVRKSCCDRLSEWDRDVCNSCGTPLLNIDNPSPTPVGDDIDQDVRNNYSAPLFSRDSFPPSPPADTTELPVTDIPHSEIQQLSIIDESRGITTSTDITYTSKNSVVRRRNRQSNSEEFGGEQRGSPPSPQQGDAEKDENVDSRSNTSQRIMHVLLTVYLYLIKPPFITLPRTLDDIDLHLSFLRSWILGADACLFGGAWAILSSTSASENPILQTFVQLSASFAFFGIVFGLLLSYNIFMMKDSFLQWAAPNNWNRGSASRVSVWNPTIMINLPLTWTAWACLNMVLFMILYAWNIDPHSNPSIAKNIPGVFTTFVIMWSVFYVYMIQREVSRCKLYPREEVV